MFHCPRSCLGAALCSQRLVHARDLPSHRQFTHPVHPVHIIQTPAIAAIPHQWLAKSRRSQHTRRQTRKMTKKKAKGGGEEGKDDDGEKMMEKKTTEGAKKRRKKTNKKTKKKIKKKTTKEEGSSRGIAGWTRCESTGALGSCFTTTADHPVSLAAVREDRRSSSR